jgi:hypothetical protein
MTAVNRDPHTKYTYEPSSVTPLIDIQQREKYKQYLDVSTKGQVCTMSPRNLQVYSPHALSSAEPCTKASYI